MSSHLKLHVETETDDLAESAVQAVVNQTILAVAERFGFAFGKRPAGPIKAITNENAPARLKHAHDLANAVQHRYGHHHFERHTIYYLFGAPMKALRQPESAHGLSLRQVSLIYALERFAKAKGLTPEPTAHLHLGHEKLQLNNLEAAEIGAFRCQLSTHLHEGWRHLHFADTDSAQRLQVALTFAPLVTPEMAAAFATTFYGPQPAKAGS